MVFSADSTVMAMIAAKTLFVKVAMLIDFARMLVKNTSDGILVTKFDITCEVS